MKLKVLQGFLSTVDNNLDSIIGIIDEDDYRNTLNILDVLTNQRINKVLYNLGLRFCLNKVNYDNSTTCLQVLPLKTNGVEPFYTIEKLDCDIWYLDITDPDKNVKILRDYLSKIFTEQEVEFILNRLCNTAQQSNPYDEVYEAMDNATANYNCYDYTTVGDSSIQALIANLSSSKNYRNVIDNDLAENKMDVPDYKDILAYFSSVFDNPNVEEQVDINDEVYTQTNKCLINPDSFLAHYKSSTDQSGLLTSKVAGGGGYIVQNGEYIPMYNLYTLNVKSVSRYYNYAGPGMIPDDASLFNEYKASNGTMEHYKPEDILGRNSNNELPIQQEEQKYFKKLKDLIDVGISIENNAISDIVFNELEDKIVYSKFVEYYLRIIGEEAYDLTQVHTATTRPTIDVHNLDDNDNDNDNGSALMEANIYYGFLWGDFIHDPQANKYYFKAIENLQDSVTGFNAEQSVMNGNFSIKDLIPNRAVEEGYSGVTESIRDSCIRVIKKNFRQPDVLDTGSLTNNFSTESTTINWSDSMNNLVAYIESSSNRYRWAEAVIKLLRFGRRKPKYLSIDGATQKVTIPNSLTNEKVVTTVKSYYDILNSTITKFNPDNTRFELYNPIEGSEYKIAGFLTGTLGSNPMSSYKDIKDGNVIVGVILMKEFNQGLQIQYSYIDIFTFNFLLDSKGQVGMIKKTSNGLETVNNFIPYKVYLDDIYNVNSIDTVPLINLSEIVTENGDNDSITSHLKKVIGGLTTQSVRNLSFVLNDNSTVELLLEEQLFKSNAILQNIFNDCKQNLLNAVRSQSMSSIGALMPMLDKKKAEYSRENVLRLTLSIVSTNDTMLDSYLAYVKPDKLRQTSTITLSNALRGLIYSNLSNRFNNMITNENDNLINRLTQTLKGLNSNNSNSSINTNSSDYNHVIDQGVITHVITVKGHSDRDNSETVCFVILGLRNNPKAKLAMISEESFNKISNDKLSNSRGIVAKLNSIVDSKKIPNAKEYQYLKQFFTVKALIDNNRTTPDCVAGVIAFNSPQEIKEIERKIVECWGDDNELKTIIANKFLSF